MAAESVESLLRSLRWLQTSREYSDLRIVCGRKTFQVHKAIICPRSKYFATSCKWRQDDKLKEEIKLDGDDPAIVRLMIDYLYQMDYDDMLPSKTAASDIEEIPTEEISPIEAAAAQSGPLVAESVSYHGNFGNVEPTEIAISDYVSEPRSEDGYKAGYNFCQASEDQVRKSKADRKITKMETPCLEPDGKDPRRARLTVNAFVYAMADKYEVENLKESAKAKFQEAAYNDWESPSFAYAADLVFSTTPSSDQGLRQILTNTIDRHRELVEYAEIRSLLDSNNGMAWALVQVLLSSEVDQRLVLKSRHKKRAW